MIKNLRELLVADRSVHLSFVFKSFFAAEIRRKKYKLLTDYFVYECGALTLVFMHSKLGNAEMQLVNHSVSLVK
jgi:hypothetical protein